LRPYSTASVLSARAAHESGATLIAIADTMTAPMAKGPRTTCCLNPLPRRDSPSLTGAIRHAQSLAAVTFALGGVAAKRAAGGTEIRLAAMSQYVAEKG